MKKKWILIFSFLIFLISCTYPSSSLISSSISTSIPEENSEKELTINNLQVNFRQKFISEEIFFSYEIQSNSNEVFQEYYEIEVASSISLLELNQADMWKSGKTLGSFNYNIQYQGTPLSSLKAYFFRVRIYDRYNNLSSWSESYRFVMGIQENLKDVSWFKNTKYNQNLIIYQNEFDVRSNEEILLSLSSYGTYMLFINDVKVNETVKSTLSNQQLYQIYDISPFVLVGQKNIIEIEVAGSSKKDTFAELYQNSNKLFFSSTWKYQANLGYIFNETETIVLSSLKSEFFETKPVEIETNLIYQDYDFQVSYKKVSFDKELVSATNHSYQQNLPIVGRIRAKGTCNGSVEIKIRDFYEQEKVFIEKVACESLQYYSSKDYFYFNQFEINGDNLEKLSIDVEVLCLNDQYLLNYEPINVKFYDYNNNQLNDLNDRVLKDINEEINTSSSFFFSLPFLYHNNKNFHFNFSPLLSSVHYLQRTYGFNKIIIENNLNNVNDIYVLYSTLQLIESQLSFYANAFSILEAIEKIEQILKENQLTDSLILNTIYKNKKELDLIKKAYLLSSFIKFQKISKYIQRDSTLNVTEKLYNFEQEIGSNLENYSVDFLVMIGNDFIFYSNQSNQIILKKAFLLKNQKDSVISNYYEFLKYLLNKGYYTLTYQLIENVRDRFYCHELGDLLYKYHAGLNFNYALKTYSIKPYLYKDKTIIEVPAEIKNQIKNFSSQIPMRFKGVKITFQSIYGTIRYSWTYEMSKFEHDVYNPHNSSLYYELPLVGHYKSILANNHNYETYQDSYYKGLEILSADDMFVSFKVASGNYQFISSPW